MTATLERTIEHQVKIELSGPEIAELFWSLDEQAQSAFFNVLGFKSRLCVKLQTLTDCGMLNWDGRYAMKTIGEYGPSSNKL